MGEYMNRGKFGLFGFRFQKLGMGALFRFGYSHLKPIYCTSSYHCVLVENKMAKVDRRKLSRTENIALGLAWTTLHC